MVSANLGAILNFALSSRRILGDSWQAYVVVGIKLLNDLLTCL